MTDSTELIEFFKPRLLNRRKKKTSSRLSQQLSLRAVEHYQNYPQIVSPAFDYITRKINVDGM